MGRNKKVNVSGSKQGAVEGSSSEQSSKLVKRAYSPSQPVTQSLSKMRGGRMDEFWAKLSSIQQEKYNLLTSPQGEVASPQGRAGLMGEKVEGSPKQEELGKKSSISHRSANSDFLQHEELSEKHYQSLKDFWE